jgi:hypothetical protein
MIGTVKIINKQRSRAGVLVRGYGYSVLLGDDLPLEIGDEVDGNLRDMGEELLFNVTQGIRFDAFIDDADQDDDLIVQSVFYPGRFC